MHTLCFVTIPLMGSFFVIFPHSLPFCLTMFLFMHLFVCFEPAFASLPLDCLKQQKGNATTQDLKQLIPPLLESLYGGGGI